MNHSSQWEKEFDEFIDSLPSRVGETPRVVLKCWIRQHFIPKQTLRDEIEKMPITYDEGLERCGCGKTYSCNFKKGFNAALSDLKSTLLDKKDI